MELGIGIAQKQQQTITMSPEHIMGKSMLKMPLQELVQFINAQASENPALILDDGPNCPSCGSTLIDNACPVCGSKAIVSIDEFADYDEWLPKRPYMQPNDDYCEVYAGVAAPQSLTDYLKMQANVILKEDDIQVAEYIIDLLDEDGYLNEPLIDIANLFHLSVPQVESILAAIQHMDPPAMGSRNLRESLLIQLSYIDAHDEEKRIALEILTNYWDDFCRMKLAHISKVSHINKDKVLLGAKLIREKLTP